MPKKQKDVLAEVIAYKTVGNLKVAEEIANVLMQQGKFRNILTSKTVIRNYIAACIYLLAGHLPVEVQQDGDTPSGDWPPVRYRSRVGDLAHLLVMLTYLPSQIYALFNEKPEIQQYLGAHFQLYRNGRNEELNRCYESLMDVADKTIADKKWVQYTHDEYVFRPPVTSVSQIMEPVPASIFNCRMLSASRVYNKFVNDINRLLLERHVPACFTLEELGRRLKFLRMNSDLTQSQLAERIGVSDVAVSRIESGDKKSFSADVLFLYIRYFSAIINIDILFDDRMWKLAMQDRELLLKRISTNSIVNRKLELLKQSMQTMIERTKENLLIEIEGINRHVELGMDAILAFTDEENKELEGQPTECPII